MSILPRLSHGVLTLKIDTKDDLYKSYMPFIQSGGLFVPTTRSYQLGEEVFMLLSLPEDNDKIPVTGKVVWVTPRISQGGRTPGIGIQLSSEDSGLVSKIETQLAGMLNTKRKTSTL